MNSENYNENHEVEEVMALGADYFAALVYRVESSGIQVFEATKSIINQFEFRGTVSPRQAASLLKFKYRYDP
jgi:hypothetical protein